MPKLDAEKLTGPLAGGSPDACVSLRAFSTGEMRAPPGWLHRESGRMATLRGIGFGVPERAMVWAPCPVFLIEHPTAGHVLIDTGLPAAAAIDTRAALGRLGARLYKVRADSSQPLPARLRALKIDPHEIATVVMTHLHIDHAGCLGELPAAKVVTTIAEWRSANARLPFTRGYRKRQYEQALDFRLIDYDAPAISSFASFGRAFDLFGDGAITLVSTPGHTAGHQSVVVRLRGREALLCGDAAYTRRTIDATALPLHMHDEHQFRRSLREIRQYAQMTPSALLVPGHDAEAFARLEPLYS